MFNWIITILSFSLLMGGNIPDESGPCRVVTEITVQWVEDGTSCHRRYSGQGEMNKLLHYLRHLDAAEVSTGHEGSSGPIYEIRLLLSDGSSAQYIQNSLFYLQKDGGSWQQIDPEQAIRLPLILAAMDANAL